MKNQVLQDEIVLPRETNAEWAEKAAQERFSPDRTACLTQVSPRIEKEKDLIAARKRAGMEEKRKENRCNLCEGWLLSGKLYCLPCDYKMVKRSMEMKL